MKNKEQLIGTNLIQKERERQIEEEGFTQHLDDHLTFGELATAASLYAQPRHRDLASTPAHWPFRPQWWKPSDSECGSIEDRQRDLVKAGALCAAEIDRLERLKNKKNLD